MPDVVFVAVMVALTGVAGLLIIGCDRLLGPDDRALAEDGRGETAGDSARQAAADRAGPLT